MRLVVKQSDSVVNEYQFDEGPIRIGRQANSQILLENRSVSKQHAVIFNTEDGKWMVEDLDSANKTYLNDDAIHRAEIKTGDLIRIVDFSIEVSLNGQQQDSTPKSSLHLEDTLTGASRGPQIIARDLDSAQAPPIRFPAARIPDFLEAIDILSKAEDVDKVLLGLLDIIQKQFKSYQFWCALRNDPSGAMTCHAGRTREGSTIEMGELKMNEKISLAVERNKFLLILFSRVPDKELKKQVRSLAIAPIISKSGCFGVIYINNAIGDDHYSINDLDYLMMLGMHTASVLEKL